MTRSDRASPPLYPSDITVEEANLLIELRQMDFYTVGQSDHRARVIAATRLVAKYLRPATKNRASSS